VTRYPWGTRTTDDEDDLLHWLAAPSGVAGVTAGSHMQGPAAGCTWKNPASTAVVQTSLYVAIVEHQHNGGFVCNNQHCPLSTC